MGFVDILLSLLIHFVPSQILDSHTIFDGLHSHIGGHLGEEGTLEHVGHDVIHTDAPFLGKVGDRMGSANGHLIGNLASGDQQGSFQNSGKAHRIVHLVGKITATSGHNVCTCFFCLVGIDFRHWIGAHENNRLVRHQLNPFGFDGIGTRFGQRHQQISIFEGFFFSLNMFRISYLAKFPLAIITGIATVTLTLVVQGFLAVEHNHFLRICSIADHQTGNASVGGTRTIQHGLDF